LSFPQVLAAQARQASRSLSELPGARLTPDGKAGHPPAPSVEKMPTPPPQATQRKLPPPAKSVALISSSRCVFFVFSPSAHFTNSTLFNLQVAKTHTWKSAQNGTISLDFPIKLLPPYNLKFAQKNNAI
jgi:hypothetical protein